MSGIEELRERVTDAEKYFGSNDAQRAGYGERLIVMMNAVEGRIREQRDEITQQAAMIENHEIEAAAQQTEIDSQRTAISQQAGEIEHLKTAGVGTGEENEQLRDMLHALLQTIESSGRDGLAEAMQEFDRKANALVDPAAAVPVAESTTEESIQRGDESPAEAAIVEPAFEEIVEPATEALEETALAVAPEAAFENFPEFTDVTAAEIAAEINAERSDESPSGSLDEIMKRVSRLVEETEAAIAMPVPGGLAATSGLGAEWLANAVAEDKAEDMTDDAVETPAQLATGTDS
jgi:chromosome segregation ATPase